MGLPHRLMALQQALQQRFKRVGGLAHQLARPGPLASVSSLESLRLR